MSLLFTVVRIKSPPICSNSIIRKIIKLNDNREIQENGKIKCKSWEEARLHRCHERVGTYTVPHGCMPLRASVHDVGNSKTLIGLIYPMHQL